MGTSIPAAGREDSGDLSGPTAHLSRRHTGGRGGRAGGLAAAPARDSLPLQQNARFSTYRLPGKMSAGPGPDAVSAGPRVALRAGRAARAGGAAGRAARPRRGETPRLPPAGRSPSAPSRAPRAPPGLRRSAPRACRPPAASQTISSGGAWPARPPATLRRRFAAPGKPAAAPPSASTPRGPSRQQGHPRAWRRKRPLPSPTADSHFCWVIRKALIENWVRLTTY